MGSGPYRQDSRAVAVRGLGRLEFRDYMRAGETGVQGDYRGLERLEY